MMTPKEKRSARVSQGSPISNSGAAYAKVPGVDSTIHQVPFFRDLNLDSKI
jgi:hypothetical protein